MHVTLIVVGHPCRLTGLPHNTVFHWKNAFSNIATDGATAVFCKDQLPPPPL